MAQDNKNEGSEAKVYGVVDLKNEEIDEYCRTTPLNDDTECGFWCLKGQLLQRMANKKTLVIIFGMATSLFGATFSYFNATISTMERVFKIPSRTIGIICSGNDIVKLLGSVILSYYATKGHQPRWIAMGILCSAIGCFLNAMPHLLYESGDDVLQWTHEYGGDYLTNTTDGNSVNKQLCGMKDEDECNISDSSMSAVIYLFLSQLLAGIGGIAVYSMGFSYLDDNIQKKKSPGFMTLLFFMRLVGPTIGYTMGTFCLSLFVRLDLHPTINKNDPRWLGAWWLGWIIQGVFLVLFSIVIAMFPKSLPRAAARKVLIRQKSNKSETEESAKSYKDLLDSIKRLAKNKIYMFNQVSTTVYIFGYLPFWTFLQKYMETMYRMPAADASIYSGSFGLGFAAIGILLGGFLVQKFKPNSKTMALCNASASLLTFLGVIGYMLSGCPDVDNMMSQTTGEQLNLTVSCNLECACDQVRFSHVCSMDKTLAFVSPCHAGCSQMQKLENNTVVYSNCSCIPGEILNGVEQFGSVTQGPCPVNCQKEIYIFVGLLCFVKLISSMSKLTNFLVSIRCVEPRDKSVSLGLSLGTMSLFALIPSPIVYGMIIDSACLVWNKTCTGTGNCWLLNPSLMRYRLVTTSLGFLLICVLVDSYIWVIMKDLNVFADVQELDEDCEKTEESDIKK